MVEDQILVLEKHCLQQIQPLIHKLVNQEMLPSELSNNELKHCVLAANLLYRAGIPVVDDYVYDHVWLAEATRRNLKPIFPSVEPEDFSVSDRLFLLPVRMFSLEKAYTMKSISHFLDRVAKKAKQTDTEEPLKYRLLPKLDGFAALAHHGRLYSRGNGEYGGDISYIFDRGLGVYKQHQYHSALGEIVTEIDFFNCFLKEKFSHPRNFTASLLREKQLDPLAQKAIEEEKSVFCPFDALPSILVQADQLQEEESVMHFMETLNKQVPFLTDGLVISLDNQHKTLQTQLGHTEKNHRWQLAYKKNLQPVQTVVKEVQYQISKQGRITPVLRFNPIKLGGATLQKCTAHHCAMLKKGLGPGAVIEVVRSGEVIPKLVNIIQPAALSIIKNCPSCHQQLTWKSDFLYCYNSQCSQKIIEYMRYFFSKITNAKGFGESTLRKLYDNNIASLDAVYSLNIETLFRIGFTPKISKNLLNSIAHSRANPIENYRFLSAFGLHYLGISSCRRLLSNQSIADLLDCSEHDIAKYDGFSKITSELIVEQLAQHRLIIENMMKYFDIQNNQPLNNVLQVVLTGSFKTKRLEIEKRLNQNGVVLQKQVTKHTQCVLVGIDPGVSKIQKAKALGIKRLNKEEFLETYLDKKNIFE